MFERDGAGGPQGWLIPYRPERLVLPKPIACSIDDRCLRLVVVRELPSGRLSVELMPYEPEDPCTG